MLKSACPLDCPDSCSLDVTIRDGRVSALDGNHDNPITAGFICGKVRHFHELMYGPDRVLYPAVRSGPKGSGEFRRVSWDEALERIVNRLTEIRDQFGGEAILPYCYGGSNGWLTQNGLDARFFHRLGASRLARTLCAMPASTASAGLYGRMPGVAFEDYPAARLIVLWGVNPAATGIHLAPYIKQAQANGARLAVLDPRRTQFARQADLHLPLRPGSDLPVALAIIRWLFESGHADLPFLETHARNWQALRERSQAWTFERAAEIAGIAAGDIRALAELYVDSSPAVIRCGWGLERNVNGGSAIAAVLALPAVAGKFGVHGGGYTMSQGAAWDVDAMAGAAAPAPATRIINMNLLGETLRPQFQPPVRALFVYNCNPVATVPEQNKVREGLFAGGPVHDRARTGDDRHGSLCRRPLAGDHVSGACRGSPQLWSDDRAVHAPGRRASRRGPLEPLAVRPAVSSAGTVATGRPGDGGRTSAGDRRHLFLRRAAGRVVRRDGQGPAALWHAAGAICRRLPRNA